MADTSGQIVAVGMEAKGSAQGDLSSGSAMGQAPGARMEENPAWPMISRLPVMLAVKIPLSRFRVRDLVGLKCGQTIESEWGATGDVPLKVGALQLGWGEFEVVEQSMALRLTRLA